MLDLGIFFVQPFPLRSKYEIVSLVLSAIYADDSGEKRLPSMVLVMPY